VVDEALEDGAADQARATSQEDLDHIVMISWFLGEDGFRGCVWQGIRRREGKKDGCFL
jgi:hypothetical protein